MDARLVVIGGKTNRSEIKLKLPSVFGRGRDADITIAHAAVSRQHCRLEEVDGALVLRDNGSTNGTFFGKQRIKEMVIRPGDLFSIGPLTFRAEYEHSGSFPAIGDPRPEYRDDATIQFTPGDELSDPTPPVGPPAASKATVADADELGFFSSEETEAAPAEAESAKADSGIDFLSEPEPAAAADRPSATADRPSAAADRPSATADRPAEPEAAAAASDSDDFMSAFQEDDPIGASLSESAKEAEDDQLFDMGFDEPEAPAEQPKAPAAHSEADVLDLDGEAHEPPSENISLSSAGDEDELDFDLSADMDAGSSGEADEDTAEMLAPPPTIPAPAAAVADDDEPQFELPGDEPQFDLASDEMPGEGLPGEGAAEAEFDPFADDEAPAIAAAANGLADLDGADEETPAPAALEDADEAKAGKAGGSKAAAAKGKADKGKAGKDDAKKGWWPFGKGPAKPGKSARKSDGKKEPAEPAAAAELTLPEGAEPEGAAVGDDEGPDFFAAEDEPLAVPVKPAAAKPAAVADDEVLDFFTDEDEPPAAPAKPAAPVKPAAAKPAAVADDEVLDFFTDEDEPPAAPAKPAAGKPAAAKPAAVADDEVLDFFTDEDESPAAPAKSAVAKQAGSKPAAAKAEQGKPAASKPAAAKPAADEPDLDFLGSGSDAAEKPAKEDDGLDDFFQDLGLN